MSKRGAKGEGDIHSSFVHCERKTWRMSMRFVAWGCLSFGTSFHGGRLASSTIAYLLERFDFWGGRIARLGRISSWETSSHQIAVRSVAEDNHLAELHYCGGVSRSELTVGSWSRFSGSGSLHEGRTILGSIWACISSLLELLLY